MALKLFNTLSRTLQDFVPLDPSGKSVGMYCCGPTVYDFAHVGNWRTFVFGDLVRRTLELEEYQVRHVMNITDVDDKIIKRVQETGAEPRVFTSRYEQAFLEDLRTLNCRLPNETPRATEHVPDIIALIDKLISQGFAYVTQDGSVYFSIAAYRNAGRKYGQLVNLNFDAMRVGERVRNDEYEKEALADFALWKARVPTDGPIFWPSPWGEGRPGWHIECSAMSMKLLGPSFDLHLGGEDLVFPHHEDEIAQSEGTGMQSDGKPFVKYWLHGAHLLVDGKKMSKSLGNFYTLRDLLNKGFSGREIRYLLLTAHYRETFNFTIEGLQGARSALQRIDECLAKLRELASGSAQSEDLLILANFRAALRDDLNVSGAWAVVFEWIRQNNRRMAEGSFTSTNAADAIATWDKMDSVLGVGVSEDMEIPAEISMLLEERQAARSQRDFVRADALRQQLRDKGWIIEDTPRGARVKKG